MYPPPGFAHRAPGSRWPRCPFRGRRGTRDDEGRAVIEIELEDVGVTSWWRSLLSTLRSPHGMAVMRFVARDVEHRDCAVAAGPTFLRPRCVPGDLPPDEAWCPGMTASLETVHEILAARGWSSSGRGEHPWSERFTRVVVADS